jgi:hypothetical protein
MHDDMAVSSYSHCPLIVSQLSVCCCCCRHYGTAAAGERGRQAINQLNDDSQSITTFEPSIVNFSVLIHLNIFKRKYYSRTPYVFASYGYGYIVCSNIGTQSEFVVFIHPVHFLQSSCPSSSNPDPFLAFQNKK